MSDGDEDILDVTDEAFKRLIEANRTAALRFKDREGIVQDLPIFVAFSDERSVDLPFIIIISEEADERLRDTGNMDVAVAVEVWSHESDTTRTEHSARSRAINDILFRSDVVDAINTLNPRIPDYTSHLWTRGSKSREIDDGVMKSRYEGTLMCWSNDTL